MPSSASARSTRYARYAWCVLAYNVAASAWGAYVRASGSGAGCGEHWPLCLGVLIPRSPTMETLVELTHRSTAGIATALVALLLVWAFRAYPKGHPVRAGAVGSGVLIVVEALLGAGLVLLGLTKDDASPARAVAMGLHLVSTFILLAALTVTAYAASVPDARPRLRSPLTWALAAPFLMLLLAGTTGAVAALGDTLFHATSLAQGMAQDLAATAHIFVRLRSLHPLFAGLAAVAVLASATVLSAMRATARVPRAAWVVRGAVVAQVMAGIVNLLLLAPIAMQIVHLVLADALWIALVVLAFEAFEQPEAARDPDVDALAA
jgi:heme A synthase